MMKISDHLSPDAVRLLGDADKDEALGTLSVAACAGTDLDVARVREGIAAREKMMTTGVGLGIALPHTRLPEVRQFSMALGISKQGIAYRSLDGKPVHIILLMVGPTGSNEQHLRLMAAATLVLKGDECRRALQASATAEEAWQAFDAAARAIQGS